MTALEQEYSVLNTIFILWFYSITSPIFVLCLHVYCWSDAAFVALHSVCAFSFPFPSQLLQPDRINPDDIDLENEPWYKFFSELEFGCPVSEDRILKNIFIWIEQLPTSANISQ